VNSNSATCDYTWFRINAPAFTCDERRFGSTCILGNLRTGRAREPIVELRSGKFNVSCHKRCVMGVTMSKVERLRVRIEQP
jgi:hypothetical protein